MRSGFCLLVCDCCRRRRMLLVKFFCNIVWCCRHSRCVLLLKHFRFIVSCCRRRRHVLHWSISDSSRAATSCLPVNLFLWEVRSRPRCQGQRKYAGYLSTTSWKLKVSGSRNSRVITEMMRKEKKWKEVSKRSGTALTTRWYMRVRCGMNVNLSFCQPLSQCSVRTSEQGNSQGTMTPTTRTRDYKKQTSSAVVQSTAFTSHWLKNSWISTCFSSLRMLLCLSLCTSCNCCQCTKLIHCLTCTGIPCRVSHCENGLVRCCLYTPVACSRPPSTVIDPTATK